MQSSSMVKVRLQSSMVQRHAHRLCSVAASSAEHNKHVTSSMQCAAEGRHIVHAQGPTHVPPGRSLGPRAPLVALACLDLHNALIFLEQEGLAGISRPVVILAAHKLQASHGVVIGDVGQVAGFVLVTPHGSNPALTDVVAVDVESR